VIGSRTTEFPVELGIDAGTFYGRGSRIAVGFDTRTSSPMIFNATVSGLLSTGCDVVDLGMVPTPVVQFAVKRMGFSGGLMITASHNPPEFNGIKFFASDGTEISRNDEEKVEDIHSRRTRADVAWDRVGKCISENHIQTAYKDAIRSLVDVKRKPEVIVDCANGAAIDYTPDIMSKMGCRVITLNAQPDGRFPGRMPEPVRENVGNLMAAVKSHGASMGIAHDGDADRATFVDDEGNYVTGDQSLAIFAVDALKSRGKGKVVVPINTSRMVEDMVRANGGETVYTAVGSPQIARKMMEIGAVIGGEGNGGVIFPEHQFCRDGIMAALRMLEIISSNGSLSNLVAELPKYSTKSQKLKIPMDKKEKILAEIKGNSDGPVDETDGVKTDIDGGWVLIRASGTEPIMRVTVETMSDELSDRVLKDRVKSLREIVNRLS
jgi:phosphomannomutase/phosphoglucomutase